MAPSGKKGSKTSKKGAAELPSIVKKKQAKPAEKKKTGPDPRLWRPKKNYGIGNSIQPRRNMRPFLKWPRYIVLQRQKTILKKRLKVPPAINQFTETLSGKDRLSVFKLLHHHRPPTKAERNQKMIEDAQTVASGGAPSSSPKKPRVHQGLQEVTTLIEKKKAKLVVIASDVDPIELVLWLPALCRKMEVPYCIVGGTSTLGTVVHRSRATCLALTDVIASDKQLLASVQELCTSKYNNRGDDIRKTWGGNVKPAKTKIRTRAMRSRAARTALLKGEKTKS